MVSEFLVVFRAYGNYVYGHLSIKRCKFMTVLWQQQRHLSRQKTAINVVV